MNPASIDASDSIIAAAPGAPTPTTDDSLDMSELSIVRFGRYYHFDGYRYERLADAVAYAQIVRARATPGTPASSLARFETFEPPSAADRQLMLELAIAFDDGIFEFAGFHYDRLSDAVNYARAQRPATLSA